MESRKFVLMRVHSQSDRGFDGFEIRSSPEEGNISYAFAPIVYDTPDGKRGRESKDEEISILQISLGLIDEMKEKGVRYNLEKDIVTTIAATQISDDVWRKPVSNFDLSVFYENMKISYGHSRSASVRRVS